MFKVNPTVTKEQLVKRLKNLQARYDGWQNLFTGAGIKNRDRKVHGRYARSRQISEVELTDMYTCDGISKRVIDIVVDDMVREWFEIVNDPEGAIAKALRSLKAKKCFKEALSWQDIYGGSIIVMGLDDGLDQQELLNENNLKSMDFLRVYDRWQITVDTLYTDPTKPKFGDVEIYTVNTLVEGVQFTVHETRVLRFDGVLLPESRRQENDWWGGSEYQAIYERLQGLGETFANIERIIEEFIIGILKISNLEDLLRAKQEQDILNRINLLDMSKHILNTYLLDDKESFERISAQVTGIEHLLDGLEAAMSGATGIPTSKLFGKSPKGLNASGAESEQTRDYYDKIASKQEDKMLDNVERLVYLLQIAKEGPTKGQIVDDWSIKFLPLWQPTMEQITKTHETQAKADQIYIDMGVLTPDEVALSRFGGQEYSVETHLSESHRQMIIENEQAVGEGRSILGGGEPDENDKLTKEEKEEE